MEMMLLKELICPEQIWVIDRLMKLSLKINMMDVIKDPNILL